MKTLRANAGRYLLKRKLRHSHRERDFHNFESAKTIGVLFKPEGQEHFESVKKFLSYLGGYKLQIYALGFVDSKVIPESYLFTKGVNLFSKKELGAWSMIPKTPVADDFMDKSFDILIDLCIDNPFPVHYIGAMSKAKFKVGPFAKNNLVYDMMFEMKMGTKFDEYVGYLKTYLNMINKRN